MRTYRFEASPTDPTTLSAELAAAYLEVAAQHGEPIKGSVLDKPAGPSVIVLHIKVAGDPDARAVARSIRSLGDRAVKIDAIVGVGSARRRVIL